jgi:hypothetical protein
MKGKPYALKTQAFYPKWQGTNIKITIRIQEKTAPKIP